MTWADAVEFGLLVFIVLIRTMNVVLVFEWNSDEGQVRVVLILLSTPIKACFLTTKSYTLLPSTPPDQGIGPVKKFVGTTKSFYWVDVSNNCLWQLYEPRPLYSPVTSH